MFRTLDRAVLHCSFLGHFYAEVIKDLKKISTALDHCIAITYCSVFSPFPLFLFLSQQHMHTHK